jgi:hypothetical protein
MKNTKPHQFLTSIDQFRYHNNKKNSGSLESEYKKYLIGGKPVLKNWMS